jgi:hypothetical protein
MHPEAKPRRRTFSSVLSRFLILIAA